MNNHEKGKMWQSRAITLILLIILSLLIHILIFGTFLKYGFKSHAKQLISSISKYLSPAEKKAFQEKIEKKHSAIQKIFQSSQPKQKRTFELFNKNKSQSHRPAKLVAPKSNFGWVIFDTQNQQPEKLELPHSKVGPVGSAQLANATDIKPKQKIEAKKVEPPAPKTPTPPQAKNVETKKQTPLKSTENLKKIAEKKQENAALIKKRIEEIESLQKQIETYTKSDKITTESEKSSAENISKDKIETKITQQQEEPSQQTHELTKEEEKNMILSNILRKEVVETQANASTVWGVGTNKKFNKNLIKLTKGYIEKLHGESGTDQIDRDGDPNIRPSFEELKYISYEAKINWCLQSSWKDNFSHNQALHLAEGKAVVEFTIDESGKLLSSKILQSSGIREVDSAIIKNLEFASPFPPLPKHFGAKTYSTGRIITVYAHRFGL